MSKTATVLILDASSTTSRLSDTGESFLDQAKNIVSIILHDKILAGRKTDQVGIIVYGTDETDNQLAADGEYQNISVLKEINQPDITYLRSVRSLTPSSVAPTDCIDALVVGVDTIMNHCKHYKYTKKVYLITDAESEIQTDGVEMIAEKIKNENIQVSIIGLGFDDTESETIDESKSANKRANELFLRKLAREMLQETESEIYTIDEALDALTQFHKKSIKSTTTFRGPLTFGNELRIPIFAYLRTSELKLPTAKKLSKLGAGKGEGQGEVDRSISYVVVPPESSTDELMDVDENALETVEKEELAKVYRYGKSLIPITALDEALFQYTSEKGMTVLGFYPNSLVPRFHFLSNVMAITAPPDDSAASEALSALIHGMIESDLVMLVRYTRIDNSTPKLGILMPVFKGGKYMCLYYVQVPYNQDIREYSFTGLPVMVTDEMEQRLGKGVMSKKPNIDQMEATKMFIESLDLMNVTTEDDEYLMPLNFKCDYGSEPHEAYKMKTIFNPGYQRLYQCIQHRAIYPSDPLPQAPEKLFGQMQPLPNLFDPNLNPTLNKMKSMFDLKKVVPKTKEKRDFTGHGDLTLDDLLGDPAPTTETLPEQPVVRQIGSEHPMDDFLAMVNNRTEDLVSEAVSQMIQYLTSRVNTLPPKEALSMIQQLREECVKNDEWEQYNTFMNSLKQSGLKEVWEGICEKGLSLISNLEVSDSQVTDIDSNLFLSA